MRSHVTAQLLLLLLALALYLLALVVLLDAI